MKQKLFTLLLALIGLTTTVCGATYYNLWINGTQVTSDNADDLSVISGVTIRSSVEKPYYDATANTLYLQKCSLTSSAASCIRCTTNASLRIIITGTVSINCDYADGCGIEGKCNTYIEGNTNSTDNVLTVTSTGMGICVDKLLSNDVNELGFLNNLDVTVSGVKGGITGKYYTSYEQHATLYVGYGAGSNYRTKITVSGGSGTSGQYYGSVTNFQSINFHPDYRITSPVGAHVSTNSIYANDGTYAPYKGQVVIEYSPVVANIDGETFPDENFRNFILSQDYGADGVISSQEVESITSIDCHGLNIADLTGIEYFISLLHLYCQDNQLQTLDVSKNTALRNLYCQNNQLQTLDVSKNTALINLSCYDNPMTSDGVDELFLNLPSRENVGSYCRFYVYNPEGTGVRCSTFHVKLAKQKEWLVYDSNGVAWDGLATLQGDMNNDGGLSVADVTLLVNKIVHPE